MTNKLLGFLGIFRLRPCFGGQVALNEMMPNAVISLLKKFLAEAKKNTYANPDAKGLYNGTEGYWEYTYTNSSFHYRDRYYGSDPFSGQEIAFKNGKPYWAMNYYGLVTDPSIDTDTFGAFLKAALMQVPDALPLRGPDYFTQDGWTYHNVCEGDVDRFSGTERVLFGGREVCVLLYHGGLIASL